VVCKALTPFLLLLTLCTHIRIYIDIPNIIANLSEWFARLCIMRIHMIYVLYICEYMYIYTRVNICIYVRCWSASEMAYTCTHIVIYICMCIFVYMYICVVEYVYVYVYKCVCVSSSSVCFIASLLTCRWYVSELFIDKYIFIHIFTVYLYSSVCTSIRVYIV